MAVGKMQVGMAMVLNACKRSRAACEPFVARFESEVAALGPDASEGQCCGLAGKVAASVSVPSAATAKFARTACSQCGREFGPGDHGYSQCSSHRGVYSIG